MMQTYQYYYFAKIASLHIFSSKRQGWGELMLYPQTKFEIYIKLFFLNSSKNKNSNVQ